jgi:protein transport protein SEC61 subunit gamma-like protein
MSQEALNGINGIVDDVKGFADDSVKFLRKCSKPDKKGRSLNFYHFH